MFGPTLHQLLETVARFAAALGLPTGLCGLMVAVIVALVCALSFLGARLRRGSLSR